MEYKRFETFKRKVGLLNRYSQVTYLEAHGIKPDEDYGRFETNRLSELVDFCKKNPKYHIVTLTSDSDDLECAEASYETWSNEIRCVNRLVYYLADGDSNPAISCTEEFERTPEEADAWREAYGEDPAEWSEGETTVLV